MKKNKLNIVLSWLLLVCFIAGQYMVALHQHKLLKQTDRAYSINKHQPKPASAIQEKCYMCDVMNHSSAILHTATYYLPVTVTSYTYKVGDHAFVSISLILASGRAPPVSSLYC